uniref:Putative restriction endonuclease n=1 Tax=virus sp. cti5L29 TaxID=2826813 RepID=A0A8S5R829_9VIRU|nr:MAG TPA: putative restriction endonuclease [virus sp. cti5L29]
MAEQQKRTRFSWTEYVRYLRSDKWKRKRLALGFQRKFTCELCGQYSRDNFEVHHKTYRNIYKEPLCDLMFLCPNCHRMLEVQKRRERKLKDVYKQRHFKTNS